MFNLATFISAFLLFIILSPGILIHLPKKYGNMQIALIHGVIFSILFSIIINTVQKVTEGLAQNFESCNVDSDCNSGNCNMDASGNLCFP